MAADGGDGRLIEAAKAISEPLTKLIEVVAAGCGKVYGPTHTRRMARAEGDAMVLIEEAKARASEISVRAAQRLIDIETRRQENIEAISHIAEQQLPKEVSEDPVEPDWATRFIREAQDVSNEQMRMLWGKLLAGEVAKPGSFSPATLQALAVLPRATAETFTKFCSISAAWLPMFGHRSQVIADPFGSAGQNALQQFGLSYDSLSTLVEAGLISGDYTAYSELYAAGLPHQIGHQFVLHSPGDEFDANFKQRFNVVNMTKAGHELRALVTMETPEAYLAKYEEWAASRFRVKTHRVDGAMAEAAINRAFGPQVHGR